MMATFRFRAWPTESKVNAITQHFGERPEVYAKYGLPGHEGIDFAADLGDQIFAVAKGTVEHVFLDADTPNKPYGNNVRIRHANGYETIYAHLKQVSVEEQQKVSAGQRIGLAGSTGNSTAPHLHLTLKHAGETFGAYPNNIIDPTPFLAPLLDASWDDATFVRDLVPDGTVFAAAARFTQQWFLRNSGNHAWQAGYQLVNIGGPTLGAASSLPLPAIPPGAEAPITVTMVAPTAAGRYTSLWQPCDAAGNRFGDRVWVEIEVPALRALARGGRDFFVKAAGREFVVQGRPFRFFGYNLRGLAHYGRRTTDPLMYSRPEHQLSQLQRVYDLGARVVRLFLADREVARAELQARLRHLLDLVAAHFPDLYLLPVFTNLYPDVPFHHPGDQAEWLFVNQLLSRDFFAGRYRENYLPFVEEIVTAFRDDSNIFAWEIGNELKLDRADLNNPNDPNPWLFIRFNQEVAAAIKRIDPNHMVTTGMKSTHHAWLHTPALQEELYQSPNLDFITIHSYEGKWDREGDLRVYEDAALAARCNKPFIVEEAGFDRELFPDRMAKHRDHLEQWLSLGAQGYMPWGFIHAHEIGDSDHFVGISADHGDFQPLCDLFRAYAIQLNAGSRGVSRFAIPMLQALPLPREVRSVTGFDFQGYNRHFISNRNDEPVNDAVRYGVGVHPANVATGTTYWQVVGIHHLTPEENRSRRNIYVDVLDETGARRKDVQVGWNWEGNNEPPPEPKRLDKPDDEPGCDIPITEGTFKLWIMGAPSDEAFGFHFRHDDEPAANGELLNTHGHHSFYVVFQQARKGSTTTVVDEDAHTGPVEPVDITPLQPAISGNRFRAGDKLGIDANRPIDPASGRIAAQVADPSIIADIGVGWVRLNFVLGERWASPLDGNRPLGLTWAETYRQIINGLRSRGLRIYGLISAEAMRDDPGDQFRHPLANVIANDWIERYAESFAQIAELFHHDVDYFESFNEPDDWHGSNRNWVHPDWFALMLQAVHTKVRTHANPAMRRIRLISGPLQGLHNDDHNNNSNAGTRYLRDSYRAGKRFFGWGQNGVSFPFDGIGYHLYVAQSAANASDDLRRVYRHYRDEVLQVVREEEGQEKLIYLSEFGWQDSVVGEQRQAEWLNTGLQLVLQDRAIALGFWFCTQDFAEKFGLYRAGAITPANRKASYNTFQALCASIVDLPGVEPVVAVQAGQWIGIVTAVELNVRSGPGIDHTRIGSLAENSQVQVIGQTGEWLQIRWQNGVAFVNRGFVIAATAGRLTSGTGVAPDELTLPPGADPLTIAVAETWNRYRVLIRREAAQLAIDPGVAVAVLVTESNGAPFAADGKLIIRFENHIFNNLWGKNNPARFAQHFAFDPNANWKAHQWRPDVNAAWQRCHTSQQMEWLVFDFARQLDENAAMLSISMGAPQIMGFNHRSIGYATVQEMFTAFQQDVDRQIGSLFRFMEVNGLVSAIQQGDFVRFAAAYNGPGQAERFAKLIQDNLTVFRTLTDAGSRTLRALPSTSTAPRLSLAADTDWLSTWHTQLQSGLATSKTLFAAMMQGVQVATLDDAVRAAKLGVILNAYWAQLALAQDAVAIQQAAAAAVAHFDLPAGQPKAATSAPSAGPVGVALPAAALGAGRGGRKRALCIGIDNYAQQPLTGCVADARLWAATLVARGFEAPRLLLNQEATRNAILAAIQHLLADSQPGDILVIQYAGHGTQLDDVSGDERGGDTPEKDEALVPFDFLSGAYVLDDDLGALFTGIPAGVNVTCFMDCCHSGSLTRDILRPDIRPRFIVADEAMIEAHRRYRASLGGSRSLGKRDLESMREVVFSACQSSELAWESAGNGEFTLHATNMLKAGTSAFSHDAFIEQVVTAFGATPRQKPLLECATAARSRMLLAAIGA